MTRPRRQRGIALVLVTWVFMILGVLALDFARYMRDDAVAALNLAEETRNYYIAVGAMNRALFELEQKDPEGSVWLGGRSHQLASRAVAGSTRCAGAACGAGDAMGGDDGADGGDDGADDYSDADEEDDEDPGLVVADGEWREEALNGVRYGVRVTDEGGRISLNDAARQEPPLILRLVVKHLLGYGGTAGMDRRGEAAINTVVDSIADWVDFNDEERVSGAESGYYLALDLPYPAKNGRFDSIEELLRVRGITQELYYGAPGVPGMKDVFTPYVRTGAAHPKVNAWRAPPAVLQALLGVDAEQAAELIALREEMDRDAYGAHVLGIMRSADPVLAEQTLTVLGAAAKVVRVDARADVSVPRNQARVSAVVNLDNEITEGALVIRWFDRTPWDGTLPAPSGDEPA